MKKNVRKALAISGLAIAIGASGLTLPASADTTSARYSQRSSLHRIVRTRKVERLAKTNSPRRVIPGVVASIADNSLTMTSGNKTYTVNTDSTTRFLNHKWQSVNFSDIQTNHKIRILGTVNGLSITAKTLRDISL